MKKFLPILILLIIVISYQLSVISKTNAQTITISAVVDEHLSWRQEGDNLVIITNKTEGFILYTNGKRITKKGPVIFTVPLTENFVLVSGF